MKKTKTCKGCGRELLYISWSRLQTYEHCKHAGFLQSVARAKSMPQNHRNFFAGTVTDRVVRDWLLNNPHDNPHVMPEMVEAQISKSIKETEDGGNFITWRDASDKDNIYRECIEAVTKIEPHLNKLVLPYDYQPDYGFKTPVDMPHPNGGREVVVLNGYMDIIVHDKERDQWAVYDVKHTKNNDYWRKTIGQLSFYDLAVYISEGKQTLTTGLLQPLCKEQVFTRNHTPETLRDISMRIAAMARDMWTKVDTPREGTSGCGYCAFKNICTKFKPVMHNGKRVASLSGGAK